jgi:hypothetical protein
MALETVTVQYDTVTHQINVGTSLDMRDAAVKVRTIKTLLSAINAVVDFVPTVIQPATSLPSILPTGNGHAPIPPRAVKGN